MVRENRKVDLRIAHRLIWSVPPPSPVACFSCCYLHRF